MAALFSTPALSSCPRTAQLVELEPAELNSLLLELCIRPVMLLDAIDESGDSLNSFDTVTITSGGVTELPGPGRTLNRGYRWLGEHFERGLVAVRIGVRRRTFPARQSTYNDFTRSNAFLTAVWRRSQSRLYRMCQYRDDYKRRSHRTTWARAHSEQTGPMVGAHVRIWSWPAGREGAYDTRGGSHGDC